MKYSVKNYISKTTYLNSLKSEEARLPGPPIPPSMEGCTMLTLYGEICVRKKLTPLALVFYNKQKAKYDGIQT